MQDGIVFVVYLTFGLVCGLFVMMLVLNRTLYRRWLPFLKNSIDDQQRQLDDLKRELDDLKRKQ